MTEYCSRKNPVSRDGTSQAQRLLCSLDPLYVSVDERSMEDLVVFAKKYAGYVRYYDRSYDINIDESWEDFFENSIAVLICLIAKEDVKAVREKYESLRKEVEEAQDIATLKKLLKYIVAKALRFDEWYLKSVSSLGLYKDLDLVIKSSLSAAVQKIIIYNNDAVDQGFWSSTDIAFDGFSSVWALDLSAKGGSSIYQGNSLDIQILNALDYVNDVFETYHSALSRIVGATPQYLKEALGKYPYHAPHIALFLVFLELFKYAQQHLNKMTKRHLDFYYLDILQIKKRTEEPDHVHIIYELAKQVSTHRVKVGTQLKAGKDSMGVEVLYETDSEMTPNKARIKSLKTVFIDRAGIVDENNKTTQVNDYRIYSAPVANSGDGIGGDFKNDEGTWKTVGESQRRAGSGGYLSEEERTMQFAEIGLAVASPILFLNEGSRTITITMHTVNSLSAADISDETFNIYFSGKKEWIKAKIKEDEGAKKGIEINSAHIVLRLELDISAAPVIAYNSQKLGNTFSTDCPVMKIILNNSSDKNFGYEKLKEIQITKIDIKVEVSGVKNLILQNDLGILDANKPFYPFGNAPAISSSFYIGSSEIFRKKLEKLEITYNWKDVPADDLGKYYENLLDLKYELSEDILMALSKEIHGADPEEILNKFKGIFVKVIGEKYADKGKLLTAVGVAIGEKKDEVEELIKYLLAEKKVFTKDPIDALTSVEPSKYIDEFTKGFNEGILKQIGMLGNSSFKAQYKILIDRDWKPMGNAQSLFDNKKAKSEHTVSLSAGNHTAEVINEELTEYASGINRGFLRVELAAPEIAFGHRIFRDMYTKRIIGMTKIPPAYTEADIPNEPYSPQINSLKIKYESSETIDLQITSGFDSRTSKFFHVYPFGEKEVHKKYEDIQYLMPQFKHKINEGTHKESEGELYIGISELVPPQNLSILFQMAEGSAAPGYEKQKLYWSYLSKDLWVPFKADEVLYDSTNDLTTSGILTFSVPKSAGKDNTLLLSGQYWLRACVHEKSGAVSDTLDVKAQAVQASFKNSGNDSDFLAGSLPKATISKLHVNDANIKSISQPYASFGGRVKEQSKEYYRRVSERLRHKARAINIWDYERLVLEQFPAIYKVKCLNHTDTCTEIAPGSVIVVPISNLRNKNAVNLLKPMTSVNTLDEIKKYITKRMSKFINIKVLNPCYEEVLAKFKVQFHEKMDKGYYAMKLNEDIKKFLSPWAYEEGADITFGGAVHGSYIINFIEEREYVDYITDFELYQVIKGVWSKDSLEKADATSSRSILVSAGQHDIKLVGD